MNGLEVKWVRLAWSKSDPKHADGPTGTAGAGPAITAGAPRATDGLGSFGAGANNTAGKDWRRYGWHFGTRLSPHLQSDMGMGLSLNGRNGK